MLKLDTNYVLRFIINDNEEQAEIVRNTICYEKAELNICVIAEVIYVLRNFYEFDREEITKAVNMFINIDNVITEDKAVVIKSLELFSTYRKLDFVDCILLSYHFVNGDTILTFDKEMNKLLNREKE